MSVAYRWTEDIHLPLPTAVWVLGAHLYALLVPLVLLPVLMHHWDAVAARVAYPQLLYAAIALMMAGSAFEIAQNAADKWYLTRELASAEGTSFCDGMFYWLIVASQAAVAIACLGDVLWVTGIALAAVLIFPLLYARQLAHFAPLGVSGVLAAAAAWWCFDDPVIFLQLLLSPLTLYFFSALLQTGAQFLHGLTTAAASSGVLFLAWGIHGGTSGQPQSWLLLAIVAVAAGVLAALLRPWLLRRPATRRPG